MNRSDRDIHRDLDHLIEHLGNALKYKEDWESNVRFALNLAVSSLKREKEAKRYNDER